MPITSPNNEALKEVRKLAGRKWRDKTRTFVAEGEDLSQAAAAAGWRPEVLLCEAGSRARGGGGRAAPAQAGTPSSARARARSGSTRSAGRRAPAGPGLRRAVGRQRPRQRRHRPARRARVRRRQRRARPGHRRPVRAEGGARVDGRDLRRAGRARDHRRASCPATRSRSPPARAEPLAEVERGGRARWWSAPSARGSPQRRARRCDETAHIPIRSESLNAAMAATIGALRSH